MLVSHPPLPDPWFKATRDHQITRPTVPADPYKLIPAPCTSRFLPNGVGHSSHAGAQPLPFGAQMRAKNLEEFFFPLSFFKIKVTEY